MIHVLLFVHIEASCVTCFESGLHSSSSIFKALFCPPWFLNTLLSFQKTWKATLMRTLSHWRRRTRACGSPGWGTRSRKAWRSPERPAGGRPPPTWWPSWTLTSKSMSCGRNQNPNRKPLSAAGLHSLIGCSSELTNQKPRKTWHHHLILWETKNVGWNRSCSSFNNQLLPFSDFYFKSDYNEPKSAFNYFIKLDQIQQVFPMRETQILFLWWECTQLLNIFFPNKSPKICKLVFFLLMRQKFLSGLAWTLLSLKKWTTIKYCTLIAEQEKKPGSF